MTTDDPYPEVPPNKVGASTLEELEMVERYAAAQRVIELNTYTYRGRDDYDPSLPPEVLDLLDERSFDASYLQAIHAYIVQDIYDWGGRLRVPGETTMAMGIDHAPPEAMRERLPLLEADIALDRPDLDTPARQALETAAHHWSEMTYLHPFPDGNSRSQRVFFSEYLRDAGWDIDWSRVDAGAVHAARHVSIVFDDPTYLAAQLEPGQVGLGDPAAIESLSELSRTEYTADPEQVRETYTSMILYAERAADNPAKSGYTFVTDMQAASRAREIASRGSSLSTPATAAAPSSGRRRTIGTSGPSSQKGYSR